MKKLTIVFLISVFTIVIHNNIDAQGPQRNYGNTITDIVVVNDASTALSSLYVLDSMKSIHIAVLEVPLASEESRKVWMYFFGAALTNQPIRLALYKVNVANAQPMEERLFKLFSVSELTVSDLSGSSKDIPRLRVKIQAQEADIKTENIEMPKVPLIDKGDKRVYSNSYKVAIGALPSTRVLAINNIRFSSQGTAGYVNFNFEIARLDVKPWKDWFYSGSGKREQGSIQLTDPSGQNVIISFQLSDVEITSVSESSSSSQETIQRSTFSLRTRRFEVSK